MQLAVPYYEELTVRENLTLAAWVKLHVSTRERFKRVEQVMAVVSGIHLVFMLINFCHCTTEDKIFDDSALLNSSALEN